MKVLDPQSALLTTSEVHHFLSTHPPRAKDKPIGAYQPVKLDDYTNVRNDFNSYIKLTSPHIAKYPPPDEWMGEVVGKLRAYGLTKAESLQVLNLGVGLESTLKAPEGEVKDDEATNGAVEVNGDVEGGVEEQEEVKEEEDVVATSDTAVEVEVEEAEEGDGDSAHRSLLACIIESMDERFAGEEGEDKIQGIMVLMRGLVREEDVP